MGKEGGITTRLDDDDDDDDDDIHNIFRNSFVQ